MRAQHGRNLTETHASCATCVSTASCSEACTDMQPQPSTCSAPTNPRISFGGCAPYRAFKRDATAVCTRPPTTTHTPHESVRAVPTAACTPQFDAAHEASSFPSSAPLPKPVLHSPLPPRSPAKLAAWQSTYQARSAQCLAWPWPLPCSSSQPFFCTSFSKK